jgi:hypothetical protein
MHEYAGFALYFLKASSSSCSSDLYWEMSTSAGTPAG